MHACMCALCVCVIRGQHQLHLFSTHVLQRVIARAHTIPQITRNLVEIVVFVAVVEIDPLDNFLFQRGVHVPGAKEVS